MTLSMRRRSIVIDGKITSIKLEPGFWRHIDNLAIRDNMSWAEYVRYLLQGTQTASTRASRLRERILQVVADSGVALPDRSKPVFTGWQIRNDQGVETFNGDKSVLFIGRGGTCDMVLDDAECSRIHAAAFGIDRRWWIADLDSKNGIWIGKRRLKCQLLPEKTWISLGKHTIRLLVAGPGGADD